MGWLRRRRCARLAHRYQLSPEVAGHIEEIAQRVGISRRVGRMVSDRLAKDVSDDISAGRSDTEAIEELGPPVLRAAEIRRDIMSRLTLRQRSMRLLSKVSSVLGFAAVATYVVLFGLFHLRTPMISRNFSREYNERFAAVPMDERGGPLYLQAAQRLDLRSLSDVKDWYKARPGDPDWERIAGFVRGSTEVLDLVRRAASRPMLGIPWSDAYDVAWSPEPIPPEDRYAGSDNPHVLDVLMPYLGPLRSFGRLLALDTRLAVSEGDGARAVANLRTMLAVAQHAGQSGMLLGDLVEIAIASLAMDETVQTIRRYPGVLQDPQLAAIDSELARSFETQQALDLAGERIMFKDHVQRLFTDDGGGDGRVCATGLRYLSSMASGRSSPLGFSGWFFGPINASRMASRRELLDTHERLLSLAEHESQTPPWKRSESVFSDEAERIESDPTQRHRFVGMLAVMPAISRARSSFDRMEMTRSASRVVIAFERYRLAYGSWPTTLESLVPAYLDEVPPDMHDGQPLRYRVVSGQPLLYSIGPDCVDDSGEAMDDRDQAFSWRPPSLRSSAPTGDAVIFPPAVDPREPRPDSK